MNLDSKRKGIGRLAAALSIATAAALVGGIAWLGRDAAGPPVPPGTIGFVDTPTAEAVVGTTMRITGWALDPGGIRGVELRVDGRRFPARYGLARPDVASVKPGYPDSDRSGFEFDGELAPLDAVRHEVTIVAVNHVGSEHVLARKGLIPKAAVVEWQDLYAARRGHDAPPFYVLPGLSGVTLGGAAELDSVYSPYESATVKFGMRVPILYMRTTAGATHDWTFDPDWNVDRRCGERRIAEDSLAGVITYAIRRKLPVLFTLNGGVWADSACNVPDWDVNDYLEQDRLNCQWNERDEVMPDDYLKHLPGSTEAPELGRSLTFNVHAGTTRYYKRRNLQAAGRIVAAFAREHPELFVGVNLDPDTYLNPFYAEEQWYDYNPGTLRQFREWLAGTGPYAGRGAPGVPDLRAYRRARPLTLVDVNRIAGKTWRTWQDVAPPRAFPREGKPYWEDPWTHQWEMFRRHLIHLHYDELSQWLADVGIPRTRIFSSQGFVAPAPSAMPFAVMLDSPTKNHDSGGMSVEGSIPRAGHLGAIVYGGSAMNDVRMEEDANLFATFHRMDPGWASVEFNTADFRTPNALPTYADGYRALREMFNYGARFVSPMAWNGSNGIYAGQPGYAAFTAWRNTPLEDAMRDFAINHAFVPLGSRLWTFGTPRHADADGWTAVSGRAVAGNGYLELAPADGEIRLVSPSPLALGRGETDLLVLGLDPDALQSVAVDVEVPGGGWASLVESRGMQGLSATGAGISFPFVWPAKLPRTEQIRVTLRFKDAQAKVRLRHIALYRATDIKRQHGR